MGTIMSRFQGFQLITPADLQWRPSNLMKIPNADYLERTGTENLGARLWRLPPRSANTLHKHLRAEEFCFVLEGVGRMRVGDTTLTVPRLGGVLVAPEPLRQVFNDTDEEVLWLILGAPEELEFLKGSLSQMDLSLIYPTDPTQLPKELAGVTWPPTGSPSPTLPTPSTAPPPGAAAGPEAYASFARDWLQAWNDHDLARILSHYSDDVEFESPFVARLSDNPTGVVRGKDGLRDYFARGLAAYPDLRFRLIRVLAGVRSCVLEYESVNGLVAAERMEFNAASQIRRAQAHYARP